MLPNFEYTLHLADNNLLLGHRNSEWCGHGPVLEQDIAITNISLDLIGQARNFYQYAATLIGGDANEDSLAYLRDIREFKNLLITEQPNGDWAQTTLRQFFVSNFQFLLYDGLQHSTDAQLAAIAAKALPEITYHLRWSSEWVIRLGDGTEESHKRMKQAVDQLWEFTGEFFEAAPYEKELIAQGVVPDPASLKQAWQTTTEEVFAEATLSLPGNIYMQTGGKTGQHSENMGLILAELQFMQRAYPGAQW